MRALAGTGVVVVAAGIPDCAPLQVLSSPYGHDGFLIESEAVGGIVADLLGERTLLPT